MRNESKQGVGKKKLKFLTSCGNVAGYACVGEQAQKKNTEGGKNGIIDKPY